MKSRERMSYPIGFRFCPTDEELLVFYLKNKILNRTLPCDAVKEVDLYKYHPSELGRLGDHESRLYFFTKIERKYKNGRRPNRVVKDGYWKSTTGTTPVYDDEDNEVGNKMSLVFINLEGEKTKWIMQEYKIDGHREKKDTDLKDSWVLCCIYENTSAKKKIVKKEKAASSSAPQVINMGDLEESPEDDDLEKFSSRKRQRSDTVTKYEERPSNSPVGLREDDQSPLKKRRPGNEGLKDEEYPYQDLAAITEWNGEQTSWDHGLPHLELESLEEYTNTMQHDSEQSPLEKLRTGVVESTEEGLTHNHQAIASEWDEVQLFQTLYDELSNQPEFELSEVYPQHDDQPQSMNNIDERNIGNQDPLFYKFCEGLSELDELKSIYGGIFQFENYLGEMTNL